MKVQLETLHNNPFRDFSVDPIDMDRVNALQQSIQEDGFWGGVVCRKAGDQIQIIAGHHRVLAARAAGLTHADLFVKDLDDEAAIRIYSRENATHRGNYGTAQIGSVAAALRWLARSEILSREIPRQDNRGGSRDGIGYRPILEMLQGVPGISDSVVQTQLANLKTSGAYARIVGEVAHEIELERLEAQRLADLRAKEAQEAEKRVQAQKDLQKKRAAEEAARRAEEASQKAAQDAKDAKERADKAEKAKDAAAKHKRTFDLQGVRGYFQNDSQLDAFRKEICRREIPVESQQAIAIRLVQLAKEQGRKLSESFIWVELQKMLDGPPPPPPPKKQPLEAEKYIYQILQMGDGSFPGSDILSKCSDLTPLLGYVNPELLQQLIDFLQERFGRSQKHSDETISLLRRALGPTIRTVHSTRKLLGDNHGNQD